MSETIPSLLARYHDGELDEAGMAELVAALEADPAARQAFRSELLLTAGLRQEAGLRAAAPRSAAAPRRRWPLFALAGGALAACLAIAFLAQTGTARPEPRAGTAVYDGLAVAPGQILRGAGELRWPDGSTLTLAPGARLRLSDGEARGVLLDGAGTVQVARQQPGVRFALDAGRQRLSALGTRFRLAVGLDGTSATVEEGIVAVSDLAAPGTSDLLFPGDAWQGNASLDGGRTVRNRTALAAARRLGRVDGQPLLDLRFDEGAGDLVRDRSGRTPAMDFLHTPSGSAAWSDRGLTLRNGARLDWNGDSGRIRQALLARALSIEIVWSCSGLIGQEVSLLEFLHPDGQPDHGIAFQVGIADTRVCSVVLRYGPEGIDIIEGGYRRILVGAPGSDLERRLLDSAGAATHLSMRGIAIAPVPGQPNAYVPICYRRLVIHDRLLTLEEIRRNASVEMPDLEDR